MVALSDRAHVESVGPFCIFAIALNVSGKLALKEENIQWLFGDSPKPKGAKARSKKKLTAKRRR